jgi:hypothetical protein
MVTVIWSVTVWLAGMVRFANVTVPLLCVPPLFADTKVTLLGSVSATVTLLAAVLVVLLTGIE